MPSVRNAGTKIRNWEATRMTAQPLTRRALMTTTGAAAAATLAAPFVRTAGAAGSLRVGYWDHWVPWRQHRHDADLRGMGREGEGQSHDRLSLHPGQQALFDDRRRGIGEGRPRHYGPLGLGAQT